MSREVEEIKQRLDLVEVIKEYITVKQAGTSFKACCPFHQEKSPSFMISPQKQLWHCFGCQEGGDVFSFVQKIEGMEFYDALKLLGQKAGVKIEKQNPKENTKKQQLQEVNALSADFYHKILKDHPKAQLAREYLKDRGITEETIEAFKMGYAPETWDTLSKFLQSKKRYPINVLVESGMMISNKERKSYYDRFRDRIMIPLADHYGNIVGFTGRALAKDFQGGKYINSPQTLIYDKSEMVFGLHLAKKAIKDHKSVVIVEGNMDVISSHQAGVKHVVAVSGTALTTKQVRLLKRFTDTFIFAFDADIAGLKAMERGVKTALQAGVEVKVLHIPQGKDPDDTIREDVQLWKDAIKKAQPVIDAMIYLVSQHHNLSSSKGKKEAVARVLAILQFMNNPIDRDHYLQKLSSEFSISLSALQEALAARPTQEQASNAPVQVSRMAPPKPEKLDPSQEVSRDLVALVLKYPMLLGDKITLTDEMIFSERLKDLYKQAKVYYDANIQEPLRVERLIPDQISNQHPFEAFFQTLSQELQSIQAKLDLYADKAFSGLTPRDIHDAFTARVQFLEKQFYSSELQRVQQQLKQAEQAQNQQQIQSLTEKMTELFSHISRLQ